METVDRAAGLIRVVLTGSESTGKTTLAEELAALYGAELAPEYVREFAVRKGGEILYEDTDEIARGQIAIEDAHAARARQLLIQDTDLLSTVVYCNHYYGQCEEWVVKAARLRRPDLYLLLEIDVPWVRDEVRDREGAREEVQQMFRHAVAASAAPVVVVRGDWAERLRIARAAIDALTGRSAT
ncbi:MAG: ATP-binding protein [Gemmatimonadota bacterium]|nr:ATP-binding protein [Gemmatimonadota bacterium]